MYNQKVDIKVLQERLWYSPDTGKIYWKQKQVTHNRDPQWNGRYANTEAGYYTSEGYIEVSCFDRKLKGHVIAFLLMENRWPTTEIDHVNGDRSDNRWENLREVSHAENMQNQTRVYTNNTSGFPGVYWMNNRKQWRALIRVNRKLVFLGDYGSFDEAKEARIDAERRYRGGARHETSENQTTTD